MNTNTLILALALTLVANSAYAARSAGSRTGKAETRVMTEKQREELREKEKAKNPNAIDQATGRQQSQNKIEAERAIREAYNGTLASKSLTDVNGLLALNDLLPMSRVPQILSKAVEAESVLLNRQQRKGTESPLLRIASKNLQLLDAVGKQITSNNPKYKTEAGKKEVQDLLEIMEAELMETSGWSVTRVRNLEIYEDVLLSGINRDLLPSEATALQRRFTWEELKERCKRKAGRS